MSKYSICFLRQYVDSIKLHINAFRYGYKTLCWHLKGENTIHQIELTSSDITIKELNREGYYVFYTLNQDKVKSPEYEIYFLQENIYEQIDRFYATFPNDLPSQDVIETSKKALGKDLIKDATKKISSLLYTYMENTKDIQPEESETYYKMITIAQRYENNQNMVWNKDISETFAIKYYGSGYIHSNGLISKIIVFNEFGQFIKTIYCEAQEDIDLELNISGIYILEIYEENDLLNTLSFIQFKEDIRALAWQEEIDKIDINSSTNFTMDNISTLDVELTEEEKIYLNQETKKNPLNYIITRPQLTDKGNNIIDIYIEDYPLLNALGNDFYIGVKEADCLFSNYLDNYIKIAGLHNELNCAKYFLNGEMLFFVEDINKNLVSNLTRFSFDSHFEEYNNKLRQIQIEIYKKRLMTLLAKKLPSISTFIKSCFKLIQDNTDVFSFEKTWITLIEMVIKYADTDIDVNKTISLILEDYINSFPCLNNFYSEPIVYYRSTDTLVYPSCDFRYALIVLSMDRNSNTFNTAYYPSNSSAIDFQVREKSHYIIYAIDNKSYKHSGITYVNTIKGKECLSNYNLRMEIK